jgi:3-carboxy-cis,cis-muconate cycloisomerase
LSENLAVDAERMRRTVDASQGLMLGEAIAFALAAHMERAAAKQLVAAACQLLMEQGRVEQGRHLVDVVQELTDAPVDWQALRDEAAYLGATDAFIDRVLREMKKEQAAAG